MHSKPLSETMANCIRRSKGRSSKVLPLQTLPAFPESSQVAYDPSLAPITKKLQIEFTECEAKIEKYNSFPNSCADSGK